MFDKVFVEHEIMYKGHIEHIKISVFCFIFWNFYNKYNNYLTDSVNPAYFHISMTYLNIIKMWYYVRGTSLHNYTVVMDSLHTQTVYTRVN